MTPELTALALAVLLQAVQLSIYSILGQKAAGTRAALKPRDEPIPLPGRAGRAKRAMENHFEGLILFTAAVLVVTASGKASALTAAMAWTYLAARILYVPAYLFGWVPWRSLIWAVGFLATLAMVLAALL
ncbi:MAPEG family protein [Rhodosalinus halophilus]|uniref:MAPEG family protein n=1 Tax=Rhodosalinus halophilus TaxID=2259333 RepID=A0A365U6G3_9RHOB|nr:MAPEG family protein [Rhodosalinus halophilus]RBI84107.1 MAPEG family protein [Rhodosalinus halophilus]